MKLRELLKGIYSGQIPEAFLDREVSRITCDSRRVVPGSLFIAKKGLNEDGINYVPQALKNGASFVALERRAKLENIPEKACRILSENIPVFIEQLGLRFYNSPSDKIRVVGITGTNGKTTTTYLLESIFHQAGEDCGVIGTVNYRIKGEVIASSGNTTPGLLENQFLLSEMLKAGVSYCFMEVSSHALAQERTGLIKFHSAAFTNLSMDHLDYHENMDNYFLTKAKLFQSLGENDNIIINLDDAYAQRIIPLSKATVLSYGIKNSADVMAENIKMDQNGTQFEIVCPEGRFPVQTSLIGSYNIYNMLTAAGVALAEGLDMKIIKNGLTRISFIPGRLERVESVRHCSVFIDYAHTPDALLNVLKTLKAIASARIILVFGCGGDRDKNKRPIMGSIASEMADLSVVTSDNPRTENPEEIMRQIIEGFGTDNYISMPDRKQAIHFALNNAREGDIVLIAGKGHEMYQVLGTKRVAFNEREIVAEARL